MYRRLSYVQAAFFFLRVVRFYSLLPIIRRFPIETRLKSSMISLVYGHLLKRKVPSEKISKAIIICPQLVLGSMKRCFFIDTIILTITSFFFFNFFRYVRLDLHLQIAIFFCCYFYISRDTKIQRLSFIPMN